ncbi:hypothetical protein AMAG_02561 [Allomyces macrogynus ATCC 38327]|uniref:TRAF-type domain-containing protein n=1 Tax=Allomyces macrogynus (strain ATCC 38327) TaxID=578462 RepID=A0A0L0S336_ALLM3|nr:hypothetical protein AMAG_02561 [Allomyces macrogynus ATCC 38327]|eukprot:KNE56789.1 hypothetical protein AMAG_02561 [Allomyces macrogynus ATCC 38327]
MSKDKSATGVVQALLNDKLGINVPSSDFKSMLERLPAAAGLVSKGSTDDKVKKDEKDDNASKQNVKPVVDFWQLPLSKGDAAVFRIRLPAPAETDAEKDGAGEGQRETASGDDEDKSADAKDDASATGDGTDSRTNGNGKIVHPTTGTHEVASGNSRRAGASGAVTPTDATKLRGTDRAAHTLRVNDSSKSGDDAAEASTSSGTDNDGTESENGDEGADGESDASDDQDEEEKADDDKKDFGKTEFTMVIDAGLTATDFHVLLEHLDAHDLTVDLFVVTNGAEAHVGGLMRTFQALWLAKADKAEAKLKDRFEKTYFIVHSRTPNDVTKTNVASADAATAKLVAKLDELFKGRVMDTSRFSKPESTSKESDGTDEDKDKEGTGKGEDKKNADEQTADEKADDDEKAMGEKAKGKSVEKASNAADSEAGDSHSLDNDTTEIDSAIGDTADDSSDRGSNDGDDAADGEKNVNDDKDGDGKDGDSADGENKTDDEGNSKASPWFPPRGFLAGVDFYQIFAQNRQEELFRLYSECFANLPAKDDGKDESAGTSEAKDGHATSGETTTTGVGRDAADGETKSAEADHADGKDTTTSMVPATRARSNATTSRGTSEPKKAPTSGSDGVRSQAGTSTKGPASERDGVAKSQASASVKGPASERDGGANSGTTGARDSGAKSQTSTSAKGPTSERGGGIKSQVSMSAKGPPAGRDTEPPSGTSAMNCTETDQRKSGSTAPASSKPSTAVSSTDAVPARKRSNSAGATIGGPDHTKDTTQAGLTPVPGTKSGGQDADRRADPANTVKARRRAHAVAGRPAPADHESKESGGDKDASPKTDDAANDTAVPPSAEGGDDKDAENDPTEADGDKEEDASDESVEDKWAKIVEILNKCRHKSADNSVAAVVCVAFHGFAHDGDKAHDYWPDGKAPVDDHGSIGLFVRAGPFSLLTCSDVPFAGEIHIARGIANLLPKDQSLMMHKISSRGSPRSTVNCCASSDESSVKDLFAVPGFKPSMILVSHDLMPQLETKSLVAEAITSYLEDHPGVVLLISDPAPAGVGSLPHARSFAAGSTHVDLGLAVVGKENTATVGLIADATNVTTDSTKWITDAAKPATDATKLTTDVTKSTADATKGLLGSSKFENVAGAPRCTYVLPEGIHAHLHGPELASLLIEANAGAAAPQSRHRVVFDPCRVDEFNLMGPCLAQASAAHLDAKPTEVDSMMPFLRLFASVAKPAETDVDAKLSNVGSVLDLTFSDASNDVTYKFGSASMSLKQQRVTVSRTDKGLMLLAFDAQLQLTDASQPLALCLAAPAQCSTASPLAAIKLVEKDRLVPDHIAALLKDHQLFQFSTERYPVVESDRFSTLAKSTKLSLDFMPLRFAVPVSGGPAATLVVEFTCKFDDFSTDTRIQVSSDFVPCSRNESGRGYSRPVWTVKLASGLDLGDYSKWRNKAWDKIGKDKAFEQSSVACVDVAGAGKRPSYHLLASPGELFAALTGLDARDLWSSISLVSVDMRDVCVTVSSDAAKSQLLPDDLAQVDVVVTGSLATIAEALGFLRNYQVEGRATFRRVESESKKSFTLAAATLSLVRQQGVDCVLNLPGCPIQGSDPANRGLVLHNMTVHLHPAVSPVATIRFDVANKVAVLGIESAPVAVRNCSGELLMVKTDDGWKLIGGYFAAFARIGQNHSGRVDVRFTRKIVDKEIDWIVALHVERDGEQAEDHIALPNDTADGEDDDEEKQDADDAKIALLPALTSRDPSDILQGPGFTILVADVVLGLRRTSDAWNPHGHGSVTAAFVVAVHLPGGSKLFDLDGIVIGEISVPEKEGGALTVHLASNVTVTWGDKPDLKKLVAMTRFDWVKGEKAQFDLSLMSYNLYNSAPEWLQFLLPKNDVGVKFTYLRSKECHEQLRDGTAAGTDDEKETPAMTDADSPTDQSTTSVIKGDNSALVTRAANSSTSVSEPNGKKSAKDTTASIASIARAISTTTETTRSTPNQSLSVRGRAQTDPRAVESTLRARKELASEQGRSKVDSASYQPDSRAKGANPNAGLPERKPKDSTESKSPNKSVAMATAELQSDKATAESKETDQFRGRQNVLELDTGSGGARGHERCWRRWLVSVNVGGVDLAKLVDDSAELSIMLKDCKALVFSGGKGKKQYQLDAALDFDGFEFAVRASLVRENGRFTGWALAGHASASLDELTKRFSWIPETDKSSVDIVLARTTSKLLLPATPNSLKFGNSLEQYNPTLVKRFEHLLEPSGDAFMLRFTVTNLGSIHSALEGLAATVFVTRFNKAQAKNPLSETKATDTVASKGVVGKDKEPTETSPKPSKTPTVMDKSAEKVDEGDKGEQDELAGTTTIGLALTSNVDGLYGASFFQEYNIALVGSVQFGGKDGTEFQLAGLASPPLTITVLDVFTGITGLSAEDIGSKAIANILNKIGLAFHAVQLASSKSNLHLTVVADVMLGSLTVPLVVMVDKPSSSPVGFRVGCYPANPVHCLEFLGQLIGAKGLGAYCELELKSFDVSWNWSRSLKEFAIDFGAETRWAPPLQVEEDQGIVSKTGWTVKVNVALVLGDFMDIVGLDERRVEGVISVDGHGAFQAKIALPTFDLGPLKFHHCALVIEGPEPSLAFGIEVEATISMDGKPWARIFGKLGVILSPVSLEAKLALLPPSRPAKPTTGQAQITAPSGSGSKVANDKSKKPQNQVDDPKKAPVDDGSWIELGSVHSALNGMYLGGVMIGINTGSSPMGASVTAAGYLKVTSPALKREPSLGVALSLPQPTFFFCTATDLTMLGLFALFVTRNERVLRSLAWVDDYLPVVEQLGFFIKFNASASIDKMALDIAAGDYTEMVGNNVATNSSNNKFTVTAFKDEIVEKGLLKANSIGVGVLCVWNLFGSSGRIKGIASASNFGGLNVNLEAEVDPIKFSFSADRNPFFTLCGVNDENKAEPTLPATLLFVMNKDTGELTLDAKIGIVLDLFVTANCAGSIQLRKDNTGAALFRVTVNYSVGSPKYRIELTGSLFVRFAEKSPAISTPSKGAIMAPNANSVESSLQGVASALPREIAVDLWLKGFKVLDNGTEQSADIVYCLIQAMREGLNDMFKGIDEKLEKAQRELDEESKKATGIIGWLWCKVKQAALEESKLAQIRAIHVGGVWVSGKSLRAYIYFDVALFGHDYKGGVEVELTNGFFKAIGDYLISLVVQNVAKMFGGSKVQKPVDFQPRLDENGNPSPAQPAFIQAPHEKMKLKPLLDSDRADRVAWAKRFEDGCGKLAKTLNEHLEDMPETLTDEMLKERPDLPANYNPKEELRAATNDLAATSIQAEVDAKWTFKKCDSPPPKLLSCPRCQRLVPDGGLNAHIHKCNPVAPCNVPNCKKLLHKYKELHNRQSTADVDCPACREPQPRAKIAEHVQFECTKFQIQPEKGHSAWLVTWPKSTVSAPSGVCPTLALAPFINSDTIGKSIMAPAESFDALASEPCPFGCSFSWSSWSKLEAHLAECPKRRQVECPVPECTMHNVGTDWDHILGGDCRGRTNLQCHLCDFKAKDPQTLVHHWTHSCKNKSRSCVECGILVLRDKEPAHLNLACAKNKVICPEPDCRKPYIKCEEWKHFKHYHPLQIEEVDANSKGGLYGNQVEYGSSIAKAQTRYLAQLTDHTSPETELLAMFQLATEAIAEREEVVTEYPCRAFCGVVCTSVEDEEEHVRNECLLYELPCPLCHDIVRLRDVYDHWSNVCSEAMISCPRPGCKSPMRMLPSELGSHIRDTHSFSDPSSLIICKHQGCGRRFASGQSYLDHLFTQCPGVKRRCDGTILLDGLPDDTKISCPFACGEKDVAVSDLVNHLIIGIHGRAPCTKYDTKDKCPNAQCTATFNREHRAHHLMHECDYEMDTCFMCKQQFVAKNVEDHWKVCTETWAFSVISESYSDPKKRRKKTQYGDVGFLLNRTPSSPPEQLIHESHFNREHPHMRGVHILSLTPVWDEIDGSCEFMVQHWCFDTHHDPPQPRWTVSGSHEKDTPYGGTIANLLEELTNTDPRAFRVIAMAVFDEASRRMTDEEVAALSKAKLMKDGRLVYREAWACVVQLRSGPNGFQIEKFPHASKLEGQGEARVVVKVPWA